MSETYEMRALRELGARLVVEIERHAQHLAEGKAQSFEDYRYRVGQIRGLEAARTLASEVEADILRGK